VNAEVLLSEDIKAFVIKNNPLTTPSLYKSLVHECLTAVNFDEIARSYLEVIEMENNGKGE
jgi:hypothetical protein